MVYQIHSHNEHGWFIHTPHDSKTKERATHHFIHLECVSVQLCKSQTKWKEWKQPWKRLIKGGLGQPVLANPNTKKWNMNTTFCLSWVNGPLVAFKTLSLKNNTLFDSKLTRETNGQSFTQMLQKHDFHNKTENNPQMLLIFHWVFDKVTKLWVV